MEKKYYVYIVECCDKSLYTGYTTNIKDRIYAHNNLKSGAKYTKSRRPVILAYYEEFNTRSEACKREYEIKTLTRPQKKQLISQNVSQNNSLN